MGFKVICFGPQAAVGPGEEQIVIDQAIDAGDIRFELSPPELGLERDDLRVGRSYEHGFEWSSHWAIRDGARKRLATRAFGGERAEAVDAPSRFRRDSAPVARLIWARFRGAFIAFVLFVALLDGLPNPGPRDLGGLPPLVKSAAIQLDATRDTLLAPFLFLFELFQFSEEWKLFSAPFGVRFWMSLEARRAENADWEVLYRPHHPDYTFLSEELEYRRIRGNWNPSRHGASGSYDAFVTWVARRVFAAYPGYQAVRVRMEEIALLDGGRGYTATGRFFHERTRTRGEVPSSP